LNLSRKHSQKLTKREVEHVKREDKKSEKRREKRELVAQKIAKAYL
jgi:hypothetical protein